MSWTSRVVWQEGMFLRAQHFQQQDRWVEQMLRARIASLGPYWWGVDELEINHNALGIGRFELTRAAGAFPDGTPFGFPGGDVNDPPPLELGDQVRNATIHLALPSPALHAIQVTDAAHPEEKRLQATDFEVMDTHSGSPEPAGLVVGQLRLRLMLGDDDRAGYQSIAVARCARSRRIAGSRSMTGSFRRCCPAGPRRRCRVSSPNWSA